MSRRDGPVPAFTAQPLADERQNLHDHGVRNRLGEVFVDVLLIPGATIVVIILVGLVISLATALSLTVVIGSTRDGDDLDVRGSLRDDRNVLLAVLAISMLSGLRSAIQWGLWMGVQQFARSALLLVTGLAFAHTGLPWLRFAWTRLVLAVTRRGPLCLVTFLEDAHRRGVLKRSGASYAFRHSTFLSHLSSDPPGPIGLRRTSRTP